MEESWKTMEESWKKTVEESWKHLEAGTVDGEAVHERIRIADLLREFHTATLCHSL